MRRIWVIDDELSLVQAREMLNVVDGLNVTEPDGDAFLAALEEEWDLILVDEELWNDKLPPHAVDGSSLVASLRAWARLNGRLLPGVVILTNEDKSFSGEIPAVGAWRPISESFVNHEAVIGRTLDVEWLLTKSDVNLPEKVQDLADSLIRARACFGGDGINFQELVEYLLLPNDVPWTDYGRSSLRQARPPVTEDGASSSGPQRGPAIVLMWLLQRALSFPGLFVSDNYAAVALGIHPESLTTALEGSSDFARSLSQCVYNGPLHSLVPRRWWTPGLDHLAIMAEEAGKSAVELLGLAPDAVLATQDPVVVLDRTLKEEGIEAIDKAVRINPPGWPAEALQPWMRRSELKGPTWLREMAEPGDVEGPAN